MHLPTSGRSSETFGGLFRLGIGMQMLPILTPVCLPPSPWPHLGTPQFPSTPLPAPATVSHSRYLTGSGRGLLLRAIAAVYSKWLSMVHYEHCWSYFTPFELCSAVIKPGACYIELDHLSPKRCYSILYECLFTVRLDC